MKRRRFALDIRPGAVALLAGLYFLLPLRWCVRLALAVVVHELGHVAALVLCGAVPVYVNPEVDKRLGISLGMKREQVEKAIKEHPNAVAVLVNNPTYYGICSDLRAIVKMAHDAVSCVGSKASPEAVRLLPGSAS